MFRNRRQVIQGFPRRIPRVKGLDADPSRVRSVNEEFFDPEGKTDNDLHQDPRMLYLLELIRQNEKILVISSSGQKALAIEAALARHTSVDTARFDESMSLLRRDRNAAFFAREDGAKVLIASEIGSEGRNFQFVHHLFLFDLPVNPELLEQRIGRLDRIGQKNDIQIHVPYIRGTGYEILARWYMDGVNLFARNINGLHLIYKAFEPGLQALFTRLREDETMDEAVLVDLISRTGDFRAETEKKLAKGKNILLEMNSFKPEPARRILREVEAFDSSPQLEHLLAEVLLHYGIETDFMNDSVFRLNFKNMTDENFPVSARLSDTLTFKRKTAVLRDDAEFFSWDHPFIHRVFEYFITGNTGSCALARLAGQKGRGLFLETVFVLECIAPLDLEMGRYLTCDPIHLVVDHEGRGIMEKPETRQWAGHLSEDRKNGFRELEPLIRDLVPFMIENSLTLARGLSSDIMERARLKIEHLLGREMERLLELQKINPDIREEEIAAVRNRRASLLSYLASARPRLDALRLIRQI
nr:hypothetical protein [Desulfobacula sp.]